MKGESTREERDQLAEEIVVFSSKIDAAIGELLGLIRKFDASGGWHEQGAVSCAEWLSWKTGVGRGAARERVRVAQALGELPLMEAGLCSGELSYSKVRAMTRVATPENEELLVEMARHSTAAQLEKICRLYQGVNAPTTAEAEAERRYLTTRTTDDGMVAITIRLRPEEAERVLTAMETGESDDPVDGLIELAESRLRGDAPGRTPVDISLHVDASSLSFFHPTPEPTLSGNCDRGSSPRLSLASGGSRVSAETCRRLLCDAGIAPVLEDGKGRLIDVGRKMRTVSAALNRALRADGDGCQFPGCSNCRFVEAHHIEHWVDGGETALANLARLCSRHHKMVHEYGFGVSRNEAGELMFADPHGRPISKEHTRRSWSPEEIDGAVRARAIQEAPGWDGMPVQWEQCVDALVSASP